MVGQGGAAIPLPLPDCKARAPSGKCAKALWTQGTLGGGERVAACMHWPRSAKGTRKAWKEEGIGVHAFPRSPKPRRRRSPCGCCGSCACGHEPGPSAAHSRGAAGKAPKRQADRQASPFLIIMRRRRARSLHHYRLRFARFCIHITICVHEARSKAGGAHAPRPCCCEGSVVEFFAWTPLSMRSTPKRRLNRPDAGRGIDFLWFASAGPCLAPSRSTHETHDGG